jgi:hypothetical protein
VDVIVRKTIERKIEKIISHGFMDKLFGLRFFLINVFRLEKGPTMKMFSGF